ncbi:FkbM family methyltransferase [Candidatus Babeliales bacterium]|nr:FkbM family methyltransferase [Candidatus Babeliales bacterium]
MLKIRESFKQGNIDKNIYWQEMFYYHEKLLEYKELLKDNGTIKNIKFDKNFLYVTLFNGLEFFWDPNDLRSPVSVAVNNGEYEEKEINFISCLIKDAEIIFDIGANVGWFSLHLSKFLQNQNPEIHAFEPVKSTFVNLDKNIKLNNKDNIKAYNFGFGQENTKIKFFVPKKTGSVAASMQNILNEECLEQECEIKKLDDFVNDNNIKQIDFLKCDVEGAELLVIKGGLEILNEFKPIIFLEMLRKWSAKFNYHPNDIIFILKNLGYSCYSFAQNKLVEIDLIDEQTIDTNFLFLSKIKHNNIIEKFI